MRNSNCLQISAGGLDMDGSGTITYECTFASASDANNTWINITATSRVVGEEKGWLHLVIQMIDGA